MLPDLSLRTEVGAIPATCQAIQPELPADRESAYDPLHDVTLGRPIARCADIEARRLIVMGEVAESQQRRSQARVDGLQHPMCQPVATPGARDWHHVL